MPNVALIETKRSSTDFRSEFGIEFDQYQLCSDPNIKKVLKRDVDIDMNPDEYDWVILVGSDAVKYYTKVNSVTEYSGKLLDGKFLPIINPSMLALNQRQNLRGKVQKLTYLSISQDSLKTQ